MNWWQDSGSRFELVMFTEDGGWEVIKRSHSFLSLRNFVFENPNLLRRHTLAMREGPNGHLFPVAENIIIERVLANAEVQAEIPEVLLRDVAQYKFFSIFLHLAFALWFLNGLLGEIITSDKLLFSIFLANIVAFLISLLVSKEFLLRRLKSSQEKRKNDDDR